MPIANYSTEVAALKSIGEIQGMLAAHKAKSIMINYDGSGQPESLAFLIKTPQGEMPFRLPANIAKVEKILLDMRQRKPETWKSDYAQKMAKIHEQAMRVGWRILKDWVRAQLAIVDSEMVVMQQVFLPYAETSNGQTLFERLEQSKFKMLKEGQESRA